MHDGFVVFFPQGFPMVFAKINIRNYLVKKLNAYVTHRSLQTKYLNENTKLKYRILQIGP